MSGEGLRGGGVIISHISGLNLYIPYCHFPIIFSKHPIPIFYHSREIPMSHVLPEDIISHFHLIKSVKWGNKAKEEWRSILKVSIILSLSKNNIIRFKIHFMTIKHTLIDHTGCRISKDVLMFKLL